MIKGKGIWIWRAQQCKAGDPAGIAAWAQELGLGHVLIKVVDGTKIYNGPEFVDLPAIIAALQAAGIYVVPWVYTYGIDPAGEARLIAQRCKALGLTDVVVLDAEAEYKQAGAGTSAQILLSTLRQLMPTTQLVLSSYRYPDSHPGFCWAEWLGGVDLLMPQVYSVLSHDLPQQLIKSVVQYRQRSQLEIIPAGPAWTEQGWKPTPLELMEFLDLAKNQLGLEGANFWSWQHLELQDLPELVQAIKDYSWDVIPAPPPPPPPDPGDGDGDQTGEDNTMDLDQVLEFIKAVNDIPTGGAAVISVGIKLDLTPLVVGTTPPQDPGSGGGGSTPPPANSSWHTVTDTRARVFYGPSIGAIGGTDQAIPKGERVLILDELQRDGDYYFGQVVQYDANPSYVGKWLRMDDLSA